MACRTTTTPPADGLSSVSYFLLLLFFFPAVSVQGHFVVEKSSVSVLSPSKYRSNHDSAIGNFGIPDYGGSITGVILRPTKNTMACESLGETFKSRFGRPVFLLLDRGDCYFAKKAYNGQVAGADAVLVSDNVDEPLITMDTPHSDTEEYSDKLTIPSALITKKFGDTLKEALNSEKDTEIVLKLDWSESMPHPDKRVEYEFWTNSNDECGKKCDIQMKFVREFRGHAQLLEKGGFTLFTPRYITWYCPEVFVNTKQCKSQCINKGRYCAPDPELNFEGGYEGKDVLRENLRQICVHRVANESGRSWIWWDFVTDFHIRCSMKDKKYSKDCAETVIQSLGLSKEKVDKCMGDPDADTINPVLQEEQTAQVGKGSHGDVTYLPTLVINDVQYRGRLDRTGVLKAICAGFEESTEPPVCLSADMETNQCLENNGGCWQDAERNISACKDTFRGRICECPIVHGVQYTGDGYTSCEPQGPARCSVNNGGCWSETVDKKTFSACNSDLKGCRCPVGFTGDGITCTDVDECKERSASLRWLQFMGSAGLRTNNFIVRQLFESCIKQSKYDSAQPLLETYVGSASKVDLILYTSILARLVRCKDEEKERQLMGLLSTTKHKAHSFLCGLFTGPEQRKMPVLAFVREFFQGLDYEMEEGAARYFVNVLLNYLVLMGQLNRARCVWKVAYEAKLFPKAIVFDQHIAWSLDVRSLSVGAALIATVHTLHRFRKRMLYYGVVPRRIKLVTGSTLRLVVARALAAVESPFEVSKVVLRAPGDSVLEWFKRPIVQQFLLNDIPSRSDVLMHRLDVMFPSSTAERRSLSPVKSFAGSRNVQS